MLTTFSEKILLACLIVVVLSIGIGLRIHNLSTITHRSPDEIIYTSQAQVVAKQGLAGIKMLVKQYNQNKELWFYPPPSRVGYIFLLSSAMKISNHFDVSVGAKVSAIFSILSLLVLILIGLRFFNSWITLYALVFLSTSPIALGLARRTWQDAIVGCLGALLVYLSCEIISNPQKKIWYLPFIIIGGIAILIKLSLVVFFGLCVMWVLWEFIFHRKLYKQAAVFIFFSGISTILFAALLVYCLGGLSNLLTIGFHWKNALPHNLYAINYQSGPWYLMFFSLSYLSPIILFLFFIALPIALFSNQKITSYITIKSLFPAKNQIRIFLGLLFIILSFTLIAGLMPYCLNLRYISPIFVPYFLMMGTIFYLLLSTLIKIPPLNQRFFIFISICLMVLIGFLGYDNFYNFFIRTGANDISIKLLMNYF